MKKILVAADGSDFSKRALQTAVELARKFNSEVELLFVMLDPVIYRFGDINTYYELDSFVASAEQVEKQGELVLKATLEGIDTGGITLKTIKLHGNPANVIIQEAEKENIDLIAMGSHGYGAIVGSLLGSVSQKVVHGAKCSVLIVK